MNQSACLITKVDDLLHAKTLVRSFVLTLHNVIIIIIIIITRTTSQPSTSTTAADLHFKITSLFKARAYQKH